MCSEWSKFFDEPAPADAAAPDAGPAEESPLSVSDLVASVKHALNDAFPGRVTVVGELSNFKHHSSGHMYFRLKDADTAIDAAMFRGRAAKLKFAPADGLEVVVEGRVDVYEARGQLQLYVERMTPRGAGALELAFRQLCDKLRAEGLFDAEAKKPIVRLPRAIGVVTSPTGAALRDIRRTLHRRWPAATVFLLGSLVQGDSAAAEVAQAVALLDANAERLGIETIIIARGGGSLEDLWAFNEEVLARAIFACATPVISGVGHETDVTIADMVADCRAATPTAAAELAVPDAAELRRHLAAVGARLARTAAERLRSARAALDGVLRSVVFRDPAARLRAQMQRTDELSHRLASALRGRLVEAGRRLAPAANRLATLHPARLCERAQGRLDRVAGRMAWALGGRSKRAGDALADLALRMRAGHPTHRVRLARQRLAALGRQLEAMSYRSVLARGFSVTRKGDAILRSAGDAQTGDIICTELADGTVDSRVTDRKTDVPGSKLRRGAGEERPQPAAAPTAAKTVRKKRGDPGGPTLFDVGQGD